MFYGFTVGNQNTYRTLDAIEAAEGQYSSDVIKQMAVSLTAEAYAANPDMDGATIQKTVQDFLDAFIVDPVTGLATLKPDVDLNEILAPFLGTNGEIPAWLQPFIDSLNVSEAAKTVNK
jgi:hypothetical protein